MLYLFTNRTKRIRRNLDGLTPVLLDEAEAGDPLARSIVREHGSALGNYVQVAARRVGLESTAFALVLAGGVFRHTSSLLANTIIEKVRATSPEVRPMLSRFEPIIGVLFSALEAAGVVIDDDLLAKLIPTIPPAALFDTVAER